MDKLINANNLLSTLRDDKSINGSNLRRVIQHINAAPAVDAEPVKRGRWLYDRGSGEYFCSACGEEPLSFKKDTIYGGDLYEVCFTDYCPNCGAKMDGDGNDNA